MAVSGTERLAHPLEPTALPGDPAELLEPRPPEPTAPPRPPAPLRPPVPLRPPAPPLPVRPPAAVPFFPPVPDDWPPPPLRVPAELSLPPGAGGESPEVPPVEVVLSDSSSSE